MTVNKNACYKLYILCIAIKSYPTLLILSQIRIKWIECAKYDWLILCFDTGASLKKNANVNKVLVPVTLKYHQIFIANLWLSLF